MRTVLTCIAVLAFLAPAALAADDQAIKAQLDKFSAAWNKDDAPGMAAVMTEDATLINPRGELARGRDEIAKLVGNEHASIFKGSTYVISESKVQPITDDVAVVDVTASVTNLHTPDGTAAPDYAHHVVWVFVKKDGQWLGTAARPYKFAETHPPAK